MIRSHHTRMNGTMVHKGRNRAVRSRRTDNGVIIDVAKHSVIL